MNELETTPGLVEPHVLPQEDPIRAAINLADALRRMHREGAVCGCLNPAHIAWDKSGVRLYRNGASGLTPYLSPEQVRGEAADARSDIFAFGAILYELFSGQRAFPAHDPEELQRQILEHSPAQLTGLPEQISLLVAGCLEKRPRDRWQRINPILIELKLTSSTARQAQSAAESKENIASLRAQVGAHDERFTAHAAAQEALDTERRRTLLELQESLRAQGMDIDAIHATLSAIHESIAGLRKGEEIHTKAIEGLEVAASQTDEVVEHVVEAFGKLHEAMGERGEAKVLGPRSGS